LGIKSVLDVVRRDRLHCFGHVERKKKTERVSACREIKVEGKGGKGRPNW
jgi:hypothetical protein